MPKSEDVHKPHNARTKMVRPVIAQCQIIVPVVTAWVIPTVKIEVLVHVLQKMLVMERSRHVLTAFNIKSAQTITVRHKLNPAKAVGVELGKITMAIIHPQGLLVAR